MKTIITAFILWAVILVFASLTAHGQEGTVTAGRFTSPLVIPENTVQLSDTNFRNNSMIIPDIPDATSIITVRFKEHIKEYPGKNLEIRTREFEKSVSYEDCKSENDCFSFQLRENSIEYTRNEETLIIFINGDIVLNGRIVEETDKLSAVESFWSKFNK